MVDTLLLKTFTPLHYTCRHFTSSHLNFTPLYFTNLSFGSTPFKYPSPPLHLTSLLFSFENVYFKFSLVFTFSLQWYLSCHLLIFSRTLLSVSHRACRLQWGMVYNVGDVFRLEILVGLASLKIWAVCINTGMRRITTFRSTTDRVYDGGPIIL